jgi:phosphopantothenoylcysteine decarboxylase/phosphopantothenate--cysteine ligase
MVGPAVGPLAFGEGVGPGRMVDAAQIIEHIGRALGRDERAAGKRLVVTAGPTREPVDPVRVLTNRSSGKMGYAIAAAAWRRGFDVSLISGPVEIEAPFFGVTRIETAADMEAAVSAVLPSADVLVMAAAIADFRPMDPAGHKIKKSHAPEAIALENAPDVLQSTRALRREGAVIVGFALETQDLLANGTKKLDEKGLDMIVINSATEPGAGFEGDTNRVTLLTRDRIAAELPMQSKHDVAEVIVDRILDMMHR